MPREKSRSKIRWRAWLAFLACCAVLIAAAMVARTVYRYALTSPRFTLSSDQRGALSFQGVVYSTPSKLKHVFATDYGRSIFAVPLAERRRRLLAVDWVENAAVSRLWPNRLVVRITERKPVAFVSIPYHPGTRSAARFLMIDAQGVLLDPPERGQFAFPIISGLSDYQTEPERRVRVRAVQRLVAELGPTTQIISEINAGEPDDLIVDAKVDGRLLSLELGEGNYGKRVQNFLSHYPEIRKRASNVKTFDLRLDDRITAKE